MKYEYGMIVFYKKAKTDNDIYPMQIMGFDEKRQKYICLETDGYCIHIDCLVVLNLISEEDLELYEKYDKEESDYIKKIYNQEFPQNLNLYRYSLYEIFDSENYNLIRKGIFSLKKYL